MIAQETDPRYHALADLEVDLTSTFAVNEHSDLRDFIALVKRHILLIAAITIVIGAATYAVTVREASQYASSTTLLDTTNSTTNASTQVPTVVGIATSSAVLAPVAQSLAMTIAQLRSAVTVSNDGTSNLIDISATAGSARSATRIADRVAGSLIAYTASGQRDVLKAQISSLQRQVQAFAGKTDPSSVATATDLRTQLSQADAQLAVFTSPLSVLTPAAIPGAPFAPHPTRDAAIGLFVGLVLGVMLASLRDRLDRRIRGIDEVERTYRVPTLGVVPLVRNRGRDRSKMLADFSGNGALADAYRTIRTNLALLQLNSDEPSVVVVTSATSEEGKSAVAANLAHGLSVMGKTVLAVSADLHNPSLHEYFERSSENVNAPIHPTLLERVGASSGNGKWTAGRKPVGLVQVLAGEATLSEAVRPIPLTSRERAAGGSLSLLANNSTFFDPAVLFSSGAMGRFLKDVRQQYEVIVLDTPPLTANADATLLAQQANVLVMVARLGHVTKNQARRALQILSATHLVPTGVIVIGEIDEPGYGYGYGYRFESNDEDGETTPSGTERARTSA